MRDTSPNTKNKDRGKDLTAKRKRKKQSKQEINSQLRAFMAMKGARPAKEA